ncbi:hypothetical protein SK128_015024 [Halocaridina rubra]|uniref:Cation-transporting ATPase n=1 Tax=Halocaridina rubra TaxID=373956 RepID=A0AAN8WL74_HALRR
MSNNHVGWMGASLSLPSLSGEEVEIEREREREKESAKFVFCYGCERVENPFCCFIFSTFFILSLQSAFRCSFTYDASICHFYEMTHQKIDLRSTLTSMSYDRLGEDGGTDNSQLLNHEQILQPGTAEELTLQGFCLSKGKAILYYMITVLLVGFPLLFSNWKPEWAIYWKRRRCPLSEADTILVTDADGQLQVVKVDVEEVDDTFDSQYVITSPHANGSVQNGVSDSTRLTQPIHSLMRYFIYQHIKYVWVTPRQSFVQLYGYDGNTPITSLLNDFRGYSIEEQMQRLQLYGQNAIRVEVKSYGNLLITEILNPFYVFQIASIVLWSFDDYYLYASCIFFVSCLSIGVSLYETRKQSQALHDMVEASNTSEVIVLRITAEKTTVEVQISTLDLVPGDVVVIPSNGCTMACDAVLISGNAIVNESMLTGESVPITKTPILISEEGEIYSAERHKRHTLFCGTQVIQTRYYGTAQVLAVVVRTGFNTAKGELIRSILYPRPLDFKFYKDTMKFIIFMFVIAAIGMSYSIYIYIMHQEAVIKTIVRTLDIVTIVVPPALPAAMTVGTYYAQSRLKKKGIFCISPPRINMSGKLKLVCFDKTGTLTEDGLEVWGAVEVANGQLCSPRTEISGIHYKSHLLSAMATCHSLTYLHGHLTGDPLDIKMFEATKWALEEPSAEDTHRFDILTPTIVRPSSLTSLPPSQSHVEEPNASHSPMLDAQCVTDAPHHACVSDTPSGHSQPHLISHAQQGSHSEVSADSLKDSTQNTVAPHATPSEMYPSHSPPPHPKTTSPSPSNVSAVSDADVSVRAGFVSTEVPVLHSVTGEGKDTVCGSTDFQEVHLNNQIPYEIGIVRQFPFSSNSQRMAVMVRVLGKQRMDLYVKGAPEVIQNLCVPESLPKNLGSVLTQYTIQGFRVIALAHRTLDTKLSWHAAQRIPRDQVERDLTFVGLLVLQNMLKPETAPVIRQLKDANIRTVMVTGDNILTALSVARDCGMIGVTDQVLLTKVTPPEADLPPTLSFEPADTPDILLQYSDRTDNGCVAVTVERGSPKHHYAVTGKAWGLLCQYFPDLIPRIVARGTVFARMSPDQKAQLVEELQSIDYIVGMCGDGANDCGALKTAHVGISLSEAEASVAAPFTSRTNNIQCVPQVVCEGRCALTTNFSVFKYMALYSIIQFVSVLILYTAYSNLTDPQFLYIDLFIVTVVAVFMGYTGATKVLVPEKPLGSLLGAVNLFSVLSQIALVMAAQVLAYLYLLQQPWFVPNQPTPGEEQDNTKSWETTTIFYASSFQYLTLAVTFSPGKPFRRPLYTNLWLTVSIVTLTVTTLLMLFCPWHWLMSIMQLRVDPEDPLIIYRVTLILIVATHFVLSLATENFLARSQLLKKFFQFVTCKRHPKNKYKHVMREIDEDPTWPPIGNNVYGTHE